MEYPSSGAANPGKDKEPAKKKKQKNKKKPSQKKDQQLVYCSSEETTKLRLQPPQGKEVFPRRRRSQSP